MLHLTSVLLSVCLFLICSPPSSSASCSLALFSEQVRTIVSEYNSGVVVDLSTVQDPHVIAGVLKQFLRELPEPLLPEGLYSSFITTQNTLSEMDDFEAWRQTVAGLLSSLPPAHYETLRVLCDLIRETSRRSSVNKMTFANLSICFAPNILRSPEKDIRLAVADTPLVNAFIERLFCYSADLLPSRTQNP